MQEYGPELSLAFGNRSAGKSSNKIFFYELKVLFIDFFFNIHSFVSRWSI